MTRSRSLPILMIATLVPIVALGGVGFWLLQRSAEGSRARYRERADGVGESVRASIGARLGDVARGGGAAIRFRSTPEGEWLAPALEPVRPEQSSPREPVAARLVRREIDTFQSQLRRDGGARKRCWRI